MFYQLDNCYKKIKLFYKSKICQFKNIKINNNCTILYAKL